MKNQVQRKVLRKCRFGVRTFYFEPNGEGEIYHNLLCQSLSALIPRGNPGGKLSTLCQITEVCS